MSTPNSLRGSIVALVTPFDNNKQVDYEAIERLLTFHKDNGTSAVVMVGTTGESATLNVEEHSSVIAFAAKKKIIPILAGCGANSTDEAIALTKRSAKEDIIATLSVTPYYNKPSQFGLLEHFSAIADSTSMPLLLYNVPSRTAVDLLPKTTGILSKHKNIIGIKEAVSGYNRVQEIRNVVDDNFLVLSGDDGSFLECLAAGGNGTISVTANVAPYMMSKICKIFLEGDGAKARELNEPLEALHKTLFLEANPMPVKWALSRMKLIQENLRLPLTPLAEPYRAQVESALIKAGLELP